MGIVLAAIISVVAASPAEEIRKAAKSELSGSGYQKEMPHGLKLRGSENPNMAEMPAHHEGRRGDDEERGGRTLSVPNIPIINALMYMGAIISVVLVVFFFAREFFGYSPDAEADEVDAPGEPEPDAEVVTAPLGDAELLAKQGRYGEAIHTLLLRTLEELKRRHHEPVPSSFTSREILARIALAEQARSALAGLITAVEVSHFGGQEPSSTDYQHCLGSFRTFAQAYMGGRR